MSEPARCVDDDELARFAEGKAGAERARAIEAHVAACEACRAKIAKRGAPPPSSGGGSARLPILVGAALLAVVGAGGLAAYRAAPGEVVVVPATGAAVDEAYELEVRSPARIAAKETLARIDAAFGAHAPSGTRDATIALLRARADDVARAAKEARDPAAVGTRECLALLDEDLAFLLDELERASDRTAAEGAILAARDLEDAAVCRNAARDPAEAGRDKIDRRAVIQILVRRPLATMPALPGPADPPSKRGLFAQHTVLAALARDPGAFPDGADLRGIDDMVDRVVGQAGDDSLAKVRGNDIAGKLAGKGLALALDAAKVDRGAELARASDFADRLAMGAIRTRLAVIAATSREGAEAQAAALAEIGPRASASGDPHTTTAFALARLRVDALRGVPPAPGAGHACDGVAEPAWASCVPLLEATGDSLARDAAEVEIEVAATRRLYGQGHPRAAFARIHEAEWKLAHGAIEEARAIAKAARGDLEASLDADVDVELAALRRSEPGRPAVDRAPFAAWSPPRRIGDEALAKYTHLARGWAIEIAAAPVAEARAALGAAQKLRGRDEADTVLLPIEIAAAGRFGEASPGYDAARATEAIGSGLWRARGRALVAKRAKAADADAAYRSALLLVALLPPTERAALRFAAATKTADRERARDLAEKARDEAAPSERGAIEAFLARAR